MRILLTIGCLLAWTTVWGADPKVLNGSVLSYADGDGYTYVQVAVENEVVWAFGPKAKVHLRQKIVVPTGERKRRHKSKDLDRVFRGIYFVDDLSKALVSAAAAGPLPNEATAQAGTEKPTTTAAAAEERPVVKARMVPGVKLPAGHPTVKARMVPGAKLPEGHPSVKARMVPGAKLPAGHPKIKGNAAMPGMNPTAQLPAGHPKINGNRAMSMTTPPGAPRAPLMPKGAIKVEKAKGGYTIEEIFTKKKDLAGKTVLVRGKVVRANREIMNRNWLHIEDGTGGKGTNDLTVTTDEDIPAVGTVVLVRGTLAVDRDFGYGYKYSAIVEKAELSEGK